MFANQKLLLCLLCSGILLFGSCLPRQTLITSDRTSDSPTVLTDASDAKAKTSSTRKSLMDEYAEVLGVSPKELKNPALYQMINDWMGVPHRLGGQNKNGVDCSAFVSMTLKAIYGKETPRTAAQMADQVKRKYESQLKEGDLVFFSFGSRQIDHVGIYLANGKFVHVSTSRGVIISRLQDNWYYKYFKRGGPI